jgi:hypothetical protein
MCPVDRRPAPPFKVHQWMERWGRVGIQDPLPELVTGARSALREALARSGKDRAAAFSLLAADGLLTYALEDCAEAGDPEAALLDLLVATADVSQGGDE